MSEWWTYSLSDFLLFSPRTYYRLFELYNAAVWPGQIAGLLAGVAIAALLWRPAASRGRPALILLSACWLWVAWGYFLQRYATINWAAVYGAAGFAIQALLLLLLLAAVAGREPPASARRDVLAWIGLAILLFAVAIQPLLGPALGRPWSQTQIFGLAPDPTAAATLGALLLAGQGWRRWLLLPIPVAWCLVSGATQWAMASPDAGVMPLAAAVTLVAPLIRRLSGRKQPSSCGAGA
jgi:hypothetical protein